MPTSLPVSGFEIFESLISVAQSKKLERMGERNKPHGADPVLKS
jgi:hypothetical protein